MVKVFSSLWAAHLACMVFDFIAVVPLVLSCGFFGSGGISCGRFRCFVSDGAIVDGCSAVSCDFGVSVRKDEFMSFYCAILSLHNCFLITLVIIKDPNILRL